jgi:outer membrane receptor protein involved in Fe transport
MKKFLFLISLLFCSLMTEAQSLISGRLFDGSNNEPLIGATVLVVGTNTGSLTDVNGEYIINIDPGTYDLRYSFISYKTTTINQVIVDKDEVKVLKNVTLEEDVLLANEVEIIAERITSNETGIIDIKVKSAGMIDGISADKIRQTGDGNLAEASRRVTGVSVENGKYVYIRGLGDRYSKTTLNGVDIPGLDPDKNTLQMDIFPTNLMSNAIVSKTFSPELPADFTGGLLNIETKQFSDEKFSTISIGTSYNPQVHFNKNFLTYKGGRSDFLGFDDGTRLLPNRYTSTIVPTPYNGFSQQDVINYINSFSKTLSTVRRLSLLDLNFGYSLGGQINLKNRITDIVSQNKLGYIFSISYKSDYRYYDDVRYGEYQRENDPSVLELTYATNQNGELSERNFLVGIQGGIMYKTLKSKLKIILTHIQNGESKAGKFFIQNNSSAVGQSGYEAYSENLEYNQRSLTNLLINGQIIKSKWEIDWRVSPTYSTSIDPDIRKTPFSYDGNYTFSAGEAGNPSRIWRNLGELNLVSKIDFTKNYTLKKSESKLKFGVINTYKSRNYSIRLYEILFSKPQSWDSPDASQVLSSENIYTNSLNGSYIQSGNANPNSNQYNSIINNSGLYILNETTLFKKLKTSIGIRTEYFLQYHTGRDIQFASGDPNGNNLVNQKVLETINLFPSINLNYNLKVNQNLRFGYSRTIARPSFKELSYAQILDPLTNRIFNGSLFTYSTTIEGQRVFSWDGHLKETNIDNVDLRWELFSKENQMVSVSGFFKNFNNPIELVRIPEQQTSTEYQSRNVGNGKLFGLELEVRKNLGFISKKISKINLNSNLTLVKSQITMTDIEYNARLNYVKVGQIIERTRDMAGQSPYVINAGISYNDESIGLDVGLFYNVKGSTLSIVGTGLSPDIYDESFHSLNFSLIKRFGKNRASSIDLKVCNILNDRLESFYHSFGASKKVFNSINPGINFSLSFNHKF